MLPRGMTRIGRRMNKGRRGGIDSQPFITSERAKGPSGHVRARKACIGVESDERKCRSTPGRSDPDARSMHVEAPASRGGDRCACARGRRDTVAVIQARVLTSGATRRLGTWRGCWTSMRTTGSRDVVGGTLGRVLASCSRRSASGGSDPHTQPGAKALIVWRPAGGRLDSRGLGEMGSPLQATRTVRAGGSSFA